MNALPSTFKSNFTEAMDEFMEDVEAVRGIISNPEWKNQLSKAGEKGEVILSRLVFDLLQANDYLVKTKERLNEFIVPGEGFGIQSS